MARKRVRREPATVGKPAGVPNPEAGIAIQYLERARERIRQALREVQPIGTKTREDAELADRLLQDLIAIVQGQPSKVDLDKLPANLRKPEITLYDSGIVEPLKAAILLAEQKGGRSKARTELVRIIDWVLQTKVGAPLKPETGILGRKVYLLISKGMTGGQIAQHYCKQQHSHTKKCADRFYRRAERYAKKVDLPWPPKTIEATKVKRD